ncbi:MAG: class I SAM-dependent methyltransferase [Caldilineaceae bacterium]|nr:class I SAM-dependent methyltransferase [Caldilineaceae bacterium]
MPPAGLIAAPMLPTLYEAVSSAGWSRGMRGVTQALLAGPTLPAGPALEIGCGGGQVLDILHARWPRRAVLGVDLHPLALVHARRTAPHARLAQATLHSLPYAADRFALVLALDVFDQEGVEMATALAESCRVLQPGGALLLRVSAHPWLYGAHDYAFHTGRRYTRRELARLLCDQGLTVRRITYANCLLGAPVAGLRLLQRWRLLPWGPGLYRSPTANRLLAAALALEARLLRHADLPVGLSLWALAEKKRAVGSGEERAILLPTVLPLAFAPFARHKWRRR